MKYYFVFIVWLFSIATGLSQTPDRLNLVSSRYSTVIDQKGFSSIQPVYSHKGNTLSADSGILYEDEIGRQFFEAFGNVVITQPSGTVIHADKLHYDAAPQVATLTNNVRMVDANSVLTTNFLVYKMRDKVGTYTGGGRIISRGDTITSKNAYYFENTQDAYFRNQVVVRTPETKIYTDTMRYNSAQRMTYFFGPTNIKGNKGENLYTEKGDYNTEFGIARFSKNNLYTEETRFLKGDSLYYERNAGVGKAFRNVVFVDTLDKFYAYGGYGLYNQADGSITMTENPLVVTVVQNDSTETATATVPDSTSNSEISLQETETKQAAKTVETRSAETELSDDKLVTSDSTVAVLPKEKARVDSVYLTADTLFSKLIPLKDYKALDFKLDRDGGELQVDEDVDYGDDDTLFEELVELQDSVTTTVDSLKTTIALEEKELIETEDPKSITLTEKKPISPRNRPRSIPVQETEIEKTLRQDSLLRQQAVIPIGGEVDSLMSQAMTVAQTPDTTFNLPKDSVHLDTAQTRIVKAYYNVRMFKSDLQAVADSVYYGMADSMFRFMGNPMIWAEGSQISSDTIYMQLVQQRLDNALLVGNAFMVNAVQDSVKFNQLKGRKITAFFANNNIDRLFVDGNAENLVFSVNEKTNRITEMFHDRGARIKIKMEGKQIIDYITIRKVDQKVYPFKLVTQENEILPGFIWRPQDRPKSKEDMLTRKRGNSEQTPPETEKVTPPSEKDVNPPEETVVKEEIEG